MSEAAHAHRWVLRDRDGKELRRTESFGSRAAAEEWLGDYWSSLLAEGAESVALTDGGEVVYEMSLLPASPQ